VESASSSLAQVSKITAARDHCSTYAEIPQFAQNPLNCVQKDVSIILLANAVLFAGFYDVNASIPSIFEDLHGLDDLQIGLCYIPFGLRATVAALITGKLLDRNFRRLARISTFFSKKPEPEIFGDFQ
jgi:predicted MFS family arabinose efflux permease